MQPTCEVMKCISPYQVAIGLQTFMTGFPNWDVMKVWSKTKVQLLIFLTLDGTFFAGMLSCVFWINMQNTVDTLPDLPVIHCIDES